MKLRNLSEEYKASVKDYANKYIHIFQLDSDKYKEEMLKAGTQVNTREENDTIIPSIRFIADGTTKNVYVFNDNITHEDALEKLHLTASKASESKYIMLGYAHQNPKTGVWVFDGFSRMLNKKGEEAYGQNHPVFVKNEWLFLDKYIPIPDKYNR